MSNKPGYEEKQKRAAAKDGKGEKENTERHVYIEPGVQIDLADDLKNQLQTERNEENARQDSQLLWTKVGAILLLIYSAITGALWLNGKSQLDNIRKDERPWIRIETTTMFPPNAPPQNLPEKTVEFRVSETIYNQGKLPAKRFNLEVYIEVVKNGNQPSFNKASLLSKDWTGIIYPLLSGTTPRPVAAASYTLSQADWEDFKASRSYLVFYGQGSYTDPNRVEHWSNFCQWTAINMGEIIGPDKCVNYNNADDN